KQLEPAIALAREVADANGPQRLDALLLLGESALKAGKTAEAQVAYATAAAEASADSGARFRALAGVGLVAEAQKDEAAAKQAYPEIADKADDQDLVQWATGRLQSREARAQAREQELEKAREQEREKALQRTPPKPKAKPRATPGAATKTP